MNQPANKKHALWLSVVVVSLLFCKSTFGFDVQGHRGARGVLPENTLAGFTHALSIGVTTLELDVVITRDDVVVVTHDPELSPSIVRKNGAWLTQPGPVIRSLSADQLKQYDVGRINPESRYASRFPHQRAVDGARIPTLADVIQLVKRTGSPNVKLNIEPKLDPDAPAPKPTAAQAARAVLKVLDDEHFLHRAIIQSFNWQVLLEVQTLAPTAKTAFLTVERKWMDTIRREAAETSPWTASFDIGHFQGSIPAMVNAAGGQIWSPYYRDTTPALIAEAHDLGLEVIVWTVNEPVDMINLIQHGVDGIITDYPDRLLELLKSAD